MFRVQRRYKFIYLFSSRIIRVHDNIAMLMESFIILLCKMLCFNCTYDANTNKYISIRGPEIFANALNISYEPFQVYFVFECYIWNKSFPNHIRQDILFISHIQSIPEFWVENVTHNITFHPKSFVIYHVFFSFRFAAVAHSRIPKNTHLLKQNCVLLIKNLITRFAQALKCWYKTFDQQRWHGKFPKVVVKRKEL